MAIDREIIAKLVGKKVEIKYGTSKDIYFGTIVYAPTKEDIGNSAPINANNWGCEFAIVQRNQRAAIPDQMLLQIRGDYIGYTNLHLDDLTLLDSTLRLHQKWFMDGFCVQMGEGKFYEKGNKALNQVGL